MIVILTSVYENAAAGLEGLPVREEVISFNTNKVLTTCKVFKFEDDGTFYYEKRQGFEGKKLEKKFGTNGGYTISQSGISPFQRA